MRKFPNSIRAYLLMITVIVFAGPAYSQAASLVWTASSGTVAGYRVYYGMTPGDHSQFTNVRNNTRCDLGTLPLIENVTYYLSVSAYNTAGTSQPSAPVVFIPGDNTPPAPPSGLTSN